MKKLIAVYFVIMLFSTSGCKKLDVIGEYSVTTFSNLVSDENIKVDSTSDYWVISSPSGQENFGMNKDFSSSSTHFYIEINAEDFINSGLDISKLSQERYSYNEDKSSIIISFTTDNNLINGENDIMELYKSILKEKRGLISYHEQFDHYGIDLGGGNMFEWAKDLNKNDKDLVFVLNPEPFIVAGLDTSKLEKWIYGKVTVKNNEGKSVEVYKLLKPYDLK